MSSQASQSSKNLSGLSLKIGDTVLLYYNAEKSSTRSGYVLSDLSCSSHNSVVLHPAVNTDNPDLPNIHFATFKVLAANKYEAQVRYSNELLRRKKMVTESGGTMKSDQFSLQLDRAKRDVELELKENEAKQERRIGEAIFYGELIQLQHTLTKKYVAVSYSDTSLTEDTKLKVYLEEKDGSGCIFRVLPRYKVQSVGEEVHYNDQVKLESVATEGQFLHCSQKTFGQVKININKNCYEVNLAATDSPLTIIKHYQPSPKALKGTNYQELRGGGVVRFFHRKHECYIVAEGSFAGKSATLEATEDLVKRRLYVQKREPSTSAESGSRNRMSDLDPSALEEQGPDHGRFGGAYPVVVHVEVHEDADDILSTIQQSHAYPRVESPRSRLSRSSSCTVGALDTELPIPLRKAASCDVEHTESDDFQVVKDNKVVTNDVHFRKRSSNNGVLKNPSTSANTFWQIEKCSDSRSGEPLLWDEACRIKHLPTRMYLAVCRHPRVPEQYQPKLVDSSAMVASLHRDQFTTFKLFPVIHQDDGKIFYDSYARVKHVHTNTWLHLNKNKIFTMKSQESSDMDDEGDTSINNARLFELLATRELNHDDAFTLELVDENLVTNFNHIAGITSALTTQLKECQQVCSDHVPHHMTSQCHMKQALLILDELEKFLSVSNDSRERKNRQKLLRNLRVLELIVYLVELHQDIREEKNDEAVCRVCFGIMSKYLEGNSRKNKRYITRMVGYLFSASVWQTSLGEEQSAENLLIAMAKDNPALLLSTGEKGFVESVAKHLVDKLVTVVRENYSQGAQLLRGLSVLCECQGAPIQQNQSQILKYLQQCFQKDEPLFTCQQKSIAGPVSSECQSETEMAGEVVIEIEEVRPRRSNVLTTGERITFADEQTDSDDRWMPRVMTEFVKAEIELFINLCKGNNTDAIKALQAPAEKCNPHSFGVQITFEKIMGVLKQTDAANINLKALYVELLQVAYVEVGNNRPFLDQLSYSFNLKDMKKKPFKDTTEGPDGEIEALTKEKNEHFPEIKKWISEQLNHPADSEYERNILAAKVLRLLSRLVSFGYYDESKDVKDLLPVVILYLNCERDVLPMEKKIRKRGSKFRHRFSSKKSTLADTARCENKSEFQAFFDVKKCAMEVLDLIFNYQFYKRLHCFIYDFAMLERHEFDITKWPGIEKIFEMTRCMRKWESGMQEECVLLCPFAGEHGKKLPCDFPQLVEAARSRLRVVFETADDVVVIDTKVFVPILLNLAKYDDQDLVQGSFQLLNKLYSFDMNLFQRAVQAQLLITKKSKNLYAMINDLLHSLRKSLNPKISPLSESAQRDSAATSSGKFPLRDLTKSCWLEGEAEGYEPHQQNQRIIYNFGILSDVLTFMQVQIKSISSSRADRENLTECFNFLRALASKNVEVQQRLLQYVGLFLKAATFIGAPVGVLLKEIFSGGPSISLKIKEEIVAHMMHLVFVKEEHEVLSTSLSGEGRAAMVVALQELVKVHELDLPLRFNQALVMKHFSQMREDDRYFCPELLAEGKKAERLELLKSEPDDSTILQQLLMMTDLLASCAVGTNSGTESVCCTVYSLEELLHIICHDDIPLYRKRPFTRFIVWVYMNSGREGVTKDAHSIYSNEYLWKHLKDMTSLIDTAAHHLQELPTQVEEQYLTTKSLLISSQWKFGHHSGGNSLLDIPEVVLSEENRHSSTVYLPDFLLYFGEALLQLIEAFYSNFCQSLSKLQPQWKDTSKKLFSSLLQLCQPLSGNKVYFSMEVQVKLYRRTVHVLKKAINRPCGGQRLYCTFNSIVQGNIGQQLTTAAREEYEKYYKEEIELNEVFNLFVTNYQLAHQGPNTLKGQVDARVKKASEKSYSNFLDKEMRRPGCEYLPLGKTFQDHVKCFTKQAGVVSSVSPEHIVLPVTERLLKQLEISLSRLEQGLAEAERRRQDQVDVKSLQILRAIIYNQIIQIDPELKERDPPEYREQCEAKLHPVQKSIQNFDNAVSRLMPLLSHPCDEIVYEVLALLKVLLQSGNKHAQKGLTSLISAREHRLFPTLQRMLKQSAVAYRESQLLISKMKERIIVDEQLGLSWELPMCSEKYYSHTNTYHARVQPPNTPTRESGVHFNEHGDIELAEFRPREYYDVSTLNSCRSSEMQPTESGDIRQTGWMTNIYLKFRRASASSFRPEIGANLGKRVPFLAVYKHGEISKDIGEDAASLLQFQDLKHIELAMEVLGLMCDGQYVEMQNYLREQKESISSINMVGEVASFLQQIFQSHEINPKNVAVLHQLLQTLIEISVGNFANQEVIFEKQILSTINHILQLDITNIKSVNVLRRLSSGASDSEVVQSQPNSENRKDEAVELRKSALELKGSAVELLEAMLEETSPKTKNLAVQIAGALDVTAVQESLVDFDELSRDKDLIKAQYEDNAERALYRSYHILHRLNDYGVPTSATQPDCSCPEPVVNVWKKCKRESKSVEIVYQNAEQEQMLTKVYFQFNPEREFKETVTSRVKWNIDRSSLDDKLRDFLEWMDALKKDTVHREKLQKNKLFKLLIKGGRLRYVILLWLTLFLNLIVLIGLSVPEQLRSSLANATFEEVAGPITPATYPWYSYVLYVFGSLHLLLSLWMVTEYFLLNWRNFVVPSFVSRISWFQPHEKEDKVAKNKRLSHLKPTYSDVNLLGLRTIYVVLFLLCSILSLTLFGLFYCFCLLYIVVNNDILQRALQAVTKNGKSLLWVALLILAILFIYAVVSFVFLHESVNDRAESSFCESLGECFITVIRIGLIESFGSKVRVFPDEFVTAGIRVLFDVSFFIIITTISLNIVFGIIVDTFTELRDEKFNAERDMKSVCFICGIPSHRFERNVQVDRGFKTHVRNEHNMWTYVYYSIYLDQIDTSNHNAIEKYVYEKIEGNHIDYFPITRALALEDEVDKDNKQLDELKSMMQSIQDRFGSLEEVVKNYQMHVGQATSPQPTDE